MTHSQLLMVDVETVPDRALLPADRTFDKLPKPIHSRVVAISFLSAAIVREGQFERYTVEECRSGGGLDATEPEPLRGFWRKIERDKPRVITWNGRSFDMPVLVLRSMIYGVPVAYWHRAGDRWSNYRSRYALDFHCDLMDAMAEHGAAVKLGLHETALAMGLPGKIGADGSEVEGLIASGRIDLVRSYCDCDVLNLAGLYFRWAYLTGRTDAVRHNDAMRSLVGYLEANAGERPHFGEFVARWRASERPAPLYVDVPPKPPCSTSAMSSDHLRDEDIASGLGGENSFDNR
jgi:predicted PolB exonuclease-like 3'-5' exonuclease